MWRIRRGISADWLMRIESACRGPSNAQSERRLPWQRLTNPTEPLNADGGGGTAQRDIRLAI